MAPFYLLTVAQRREITYKFMQLLRPLQMLRMVWKSSDPRGVGGRSGRSGRPQAWKEHSASGLCFVPHQLHHSGKSGDLPVRFPKLECERDRWSWY